ncbi:hypothetical protein D3C75_979820 [compost metagenome]
MNGALANLRIVVAQVLARQLQRLLARIQRQFRQQGCSLNGGQVTALQLFVQRLRGTGLAGTHLPQAFVIAWGLGHGVGIP